MTGFYLLIGSVIGFILYTGLDKLGSIKNDEIKFKALKINKRISVYDDIISKYSSRYGVPIKRIKAIIMVESSGNPHAKGSIGEVGLMQMTKIALSDLKANSPDWNFDAKLEHLWNSDINIKAGTSYLALLRDRLGNLDKATQAYNAGIGRVERGSSIGLDYLELVKRYEAGL